MINMSQRTMDIMGNVQDFINKEVLDIESLNEECNSDYIAGRKVQLLRTEKALDTFKENILDEVNEKFNDYREIL